MPEFNLIDACTSLLIALTLSERFVNKSELISRYLIGELILLMTGILILLSGQYLGFSKNEMGTARIMFLSCVYVFIIRLWKRFSFKRPNP